MKDNIKIVFNTMAIAKAYGTKKSAESGKTKQEISEVIDNGTSAIALNMVMLNAMTEAIQGRPFIKRIVSKKYYKMCEEVAAELPEGA